MFKVGDVIVCKELPVEILGPPVDRPKIRGIYRILRVERDGLGLQLVGMNPCPYMGYGKNLFEKISKADQSFIELLRKPVRKPTKKLEDA